MTIELDFAKASEAVELQDAALARPGRRLCPGSHASDGCPDLRAQPITKHSKFRASTSKCYKVEHLLQLYSVAVSLVGICSACLMKGHISCVYSYASYTTA